MGDKQQDNEPLCLNGAIVVTVSILKLVAASAAEAELGGLFHNGRTATELRLTLNEMGWPQPPTELICDNTTVDGIANSTIKRQRSRAMNMRYFWIIDQVDGGHLKVRWAPGLENLADYFTKHHPAQHHRKVRPYYVHTNTSPRYLPRAPKPSDL